MLQEEEKSCLPREEVTNPVVDSVKDDDDEIMRSCENVAVNSKDSQDNNSDDEAKDTIDDQMLKITKADKMRSSSSLGMSRWSTEENLSLGGSRETRNSHPAADKLFADTHTDAQDEEHGEKNVTQDIQSTSSDSGIQSNIDEEAGEEEESPAPATIVQRVFGGRMRTCFQCRDCRNRSEFSDWFTDLHLAIPESEAAPPPVVQGCAPPPPKIAIQKKLQATLETVTTAAASSDTLSAGAGAILLLLPAVIQLLVSLNLPTTVQRQPRPRDKNKTSLILH